MFGAIYNLKYITAYFMYTVVWPYFDGMVLKVIKDIFHIKYLLVIANTHCINKFQYPLDRCCMINAKPNLYSLRRLPRNNGNWIF